MKHLIVTLKRVQLVLFVTVLHIVQTVQCYNQLVKSWRSLWTRF